MDIHDIHQQKEGLLESNSGQYSNIAKTYKFKGDVLSSMLPEALDFIRNIHEEELQKVKESAKKDPETWKWWTGCDTGNLYISPNTELGWEFRPDLEEIKDTLEKVHKFDACDLFGKEDEKNIVSHETVMKIYNEILEANENKHAARKEAKEEGSPHIPESKRNREASDNRNLSCGMLTTHAKSVILI